MKRIKFFMIFFLIDFYVVVQSLTSGTETCFKLLLYRVHILHETAFLAIILFSTTALETFICTAFQFKFCKVSI
jgi:hypothetical protein